MSENEVAVLTNFLVLARRPDQHKNFEQLFIQIGSLEPNLWILEESVNFVDVRAFSFFLTQMWTKVSDMNTLVDSL